MKNRSLKSAVQISETLNKYCNIKTSKMGKLDTLFYDTVDTQKQTLLLQQGHKNKILPFFFDTNIVGKGSPLCQIFHYIRGTITWKCQS
jgi:hypothetical protein